MKFNFTTHSFLICQAYLILGKTCHHHQISPYILSVTLDFFQTRISLITKSFNFTVKLIQKSQITLCQFLPLSISLPNICQLLHICSLLLVLISFLAKFIHFLFHHWTNIWIQILISRYTSDFSDFFFPLHAYRNPRNHSFTIFIIGIIDIKISSCQLFSGRLNISCAPF